MKINEIFYSRTGLLKHTSNLKYIFIAEIYNT
ncbi:hypothetical protein PARC_a6000 [Pseudoalteromonas arctica A 37-1-2]|uniref:Uncharacterized protein n=1 Tax=Pseudoalteromonas arctica A 37-1-2 TaxID=1117313 RepID=A0A290S1X0_9GAMM|nr:hypothetical protein PARC_a6000 [Pseudoalteromonas arctica A 37-1-2]